MDLSVIGSVPLGQLFSLGTVSHDPELIRERGPGLCPEPLFFLTLFPLLKISSASPSSSEEDKEKTLT